MIIYILVLLLVLAMKPPISSRQKVLSELPVLPTPHIPMALWGEEPRSKLSV